ncbi:hypothetical protein [Bacillus suaedaesalsae]|uniref:DUF2757 family protein n=1 Tax=Bacillus suaedaesalsae TaxID=2810349 RepID=A0ABS2DH30_9BACI|nr:hypothetical protein [Bacillus suaedaesalsae]MBM6617763.1 hypothetical protein [Bacillus suaedaesalsae]
MGICPLCNGFEVLAISCEYCHSEVEDKGRVIDYFDDYSPYMEIEDMKKIDGYSQTHQDQQCAHLLVCPLCHQEQIYFVKE